MLKHKFFVDFGSKMAIYFLSGLTGIVVSRLAGPEVIGTIMFGHSYSALFFFMFGLFGTSHIKLISEGQNYKDCIKIYTVIILITALVFLLTVSCFYYIESSIYSIVYSNTEKVVLLIAAIITCIQGLFKIPDITFTSLMQQVKINLPTLTRTIIFNIGRIIVVVLGYQAIALITIDLVATLCMIPVYFYLMKGFDFFNGKWDTTLFYKYLKIGFPILVITISLSLITNYSKVFLKNYSSLEELGYFAGAIGLASMLIKIGESAGSLFFPLFSKAHSNNNNDLIIQYMNKYEKYLFLFILPIIIIMSINSETIITFLLSDKYRESVPIFSILLFYAFFQIWGLPYYNLMNGINKFKQNAYMHLFFLFIFFIILYVTVSSKYFNLGAKGLALSYMVLHLLKVFTWYLTVNKSINYKIDKTILYYSIFFTVFYIVNFILYNNLIIDSGYGLKFLFICIQSVILFLLMYLLKILNKKDITYLLSVLNIKALRQYIKSEIKD